MDKLEPVIKHRFWILLGLCVPLIIYGYMSASGAIKTATEEREQALESVYSGVPGGQLANPTWSEGLKEINEEFDLEVALAHFAILEQQKQGMDWPADLVEYVPDEYRGEFETDARFIYVDDYEDLLHDAYMIADPVRPDGNSFTGKVYFEYTNLPRHEFGDNELSISSERMWNAQEDYWYLRQLMMAVRDVNAGAENIAKAPLRRIDKLEFMGGDGQPGGSSAMGGGAMFDGDSDMDLESMYDMDDYGTEDTDDYGSERDSMSGSLSSGVSVEFDPAEELGNQLAVASAASPASDPMQPGVRPGGISTRQELRYIELDETAPYRERGFYMSVLIHQRYIPDFLIRLSNSSWPIRIIRFQVGPNPYGGGPAASGAGQYPGGYDGYDMSIDDLDLGGGNDFDLQGIGGGYGPTYGPQQNLANNAGVKGAFRHPDLVQLEVLGAITFFNPLTEDVLAKVTAALEEMGAGSAGAAPVMGDPLPESDASVPEDATPAADTSNQPAADPNDAGAVPDPSIPDEAAGPAPAT